MKNKLLLFSFYLSILSICNLHAHPSWGIVVDKNKNIFFADIIHNGRGSVWKLDNTGKLHLLLSDFHAHNVSLDKNGNLVAAHGEGNQIMLLLKKNGEKKTLYQTKDFNDFFGGNCTYTPDGKIIFSINKYLWTIDKNGKKQKISDHKLAWNQAVYADQDGNIYAPDIGVDNGVLVKINQAGQAKIIAKDLISKLDRPKDKHNDVLLGIGKDKNGFVYIAEKAGQRIIKIVGDKQHETYYKSKGSWFPTGMYFDDSDLYILEYKDSSVGVIGPQIIKIDKSAKKTIIFNYENYFKNSTSNN